MGHVVIGEKYIGYTARDEIVRVEAYGKDRIRVRSTRNGSFSEESWTSAPLRETRKEASSPTAVFRRRL